MKCKNCGGEIQDGTKFCPYCGSQISYEMRREQEQLNKVGCPKCGSSNISFERETQGEYVGKSGRSVVRSTVGICHDCGYTWKTDTTDGSSAKRKTWLWVLGWIFFFPAPVMVLIWRKKNTWDIKVKIAVTAVFWILFFILGSGGSKKTENPQPPVSIEETTAAPTVAETKVTEPETTTAASKATEPETTKAAPKETKPAETKAAKQKTTEATMTKAADTATSGQKQALKVAKNYLNFMAFSAKGLEEQLEYEGYKSDEIKYAIDNCGADWNEQAEKKAKEYLNVMAFSKEGLKEQLEYDGFTPEQCNYGVEKSYSGAEGQAASKAQDYLKFMAFSKKGLIEQLEYDGFSNEEAKKAVNSLDIDWNEQAAAKAKDYLKFMTFSKNSLIEQLEYDGFTSSEANYGAEKAGL